MTVLGQRLRQLREGCRLTVRELAERIGKSAGYVSRIEARDEIPSAELLCALSEIYQVDAAELLQLAKQSHLKRTENELEEHYQATLALYRKQSS